MVPTPALATRRRGGSVRALRAAAAAVALTAAAATGAPAWAQTGNFIADPAGANRAKSPNDPGYILEQFPGKLPDTTNQCVFFRTLYDWRPLNNRSLIVWAPSRKHPYLLELDRPCMGLKFAHSIGFTSRDSRLCGFGGDSVLVRSGGGSPDRCPIGSITALTEDGLKSLLAQAPGRGLADKDRSDPKE
ncbi:MAG: DUF6491 family protein [Rhodospirillaceae bacterium]|nr:DUF6491 family protein [Rhodospirillaceae bacterium]